MTETKQPQRPDNSFNWKPILWVVLLWLLGSYVMTAYRPSGRLKLSYSDFKNRVRGGSVSEITIKGNNVRGSFAQAVKPRPEGKSRSASEKVPEYETFETVIPSIEDPELMNLLEKHNVIVNAEPKEGSLFWNLLVSLLPWVLIIGFFVYMSKKMQERMGGPGGPGGIFGFGKSKAKLYTKSAVEIGYDNVAGLPNAKKELYEVVDYLKDPSKFQDLGGELPKGILLVGPPGCGKTLLARATAGEADVPFYSISGSEFIEMFVGVGASRVRDMFQKAKKDAPAIIFIDEIDSIGRVRGTGLGGGHDEREQTLNQILAEMDGFSPHESVIVIAATNRPDVLDPALIRPGRFDRQITLELPQRKARKEILEVHAKEVPLKEDVDLDAVAAGTAGFSGADLKNLVNEAVLLAARRSSREVDSADFDRAIDKIRMGIEREDLVNEEERRIIAYHEAGHALIARSLPGTDPLKKVSIIPRGRSLGATEQLPEEDRHNLSRTYLLNRIAIMLGGRAAEKVVFEDLTSGGGDDLKNATQLARRMVCQWGMSEKLGPMTFRHGEPHPFLGKEMAEQKDFSEHTARLIDQEVQRITQEMEEKGIDILRSNRDKLDALAEALLEHETLEKDEVDRLLGDSKNGSETVAA